MTLSNLGFEDAGATPGAADAWTVAVLCSAESVATWGSETPPLEEDGFEIEWGNDDYFFELLNVDTTPALFDDTIGEGEGWEDFEEGWSGNESYLFGLGSVTLFDWTGTANEAETFATGWPTGGAAYQFTLGASTAASFDAALTPQAFEDFSDGWSGTGAGNDYDTTLGSTTLAVWDGGFANAEEQFENDFTELQVTVVPGTDLFTASGAHGLSAGDIVTFIQRGAGALPGGLSSTYEYFVIASGLTGTAFRVSVTSGGSTIDVTDAGAGSTYLRRDRRRWWNIAP